MKLLTTQSVVSAPSGTFLGRLARNLATGIEHRVAKFANYRAASPTATTTVGQRIGSNQNSTYASIQRAGMQWTSEDLQKNAPLAMAYLRVRGNYCRPTRWKPDTGDSVLNKAVSEYCEEKWKTMGFACSMQAAVARTLHIETPIRGDAGMIIWRDEIGDLRLIEFSADQVGEVYNFTPPAHLLCRIRLRWKPCGEKRKRLHLLFRSLLSRPRLRGLQNLPAHRFVVFKPAHLRRSRHHLFRRSVQLSIHARSDDFSQRDELH